MPQLPDVPWHPEVLKTNDDYRHKHRCTHNNNNYCKFLKEKCRGSAHCNYYDEVKCDIKLVKNRGYILVYKQTKNSESKYLYEACQDDLKEDVKMLKSRGYIVERYYEGPAGARIYVRD